MDAIDKVAPIKKKEESIVHRNGLVVEFLKQKASPYKSFKIILKSRLFVDKQLYNAARYKVHKLIFGKKAGYFEN